MTTAAPDTAADCAGLLADAATHLTHAANAIRAAQSAWPDAQLDTSIAGILWHVGTARRCTRLLSDTAATVAAKGERG